MSIAKTVAINSSIILAGRLISKIMGLFTIVLLARYLGVALFGQYSLVLAFVGFFLYLNDFGVTQVIVRRISQSSEKINELVSNTLTLKIVFAFFAIFSTIVFSFLFAYPIEIILLIFVFALTILPSTITSIFNGVFQAKLKIKYAMFSEIVQYTIFLLLIIPLIYFKADLLHFFLAFLVGTLGALFTSWFFVRKYVKLRFLIDFKEWKVLFKTGLPFAFTLIFSSLYSRIDVLMLSKMVNDSAVGFYAASFRITESLAIIPNAFVIPLFPVMSALFRTSNPNLKISYKLGFKYLSIFFLPIAFGGSILAQRIITLVYGTDFVNPVMNLTFVVLIWAAFILFINQISSTVLYSIFKEKIVMKSLMIGIFANVILNIFLIPVYGIVGAAISTLLTELMIFSIFTYSLSKKVYALDFKLLLKPLLASILMSTFIVYFFNFNIFFLVFFGGIIYFVFLFLIKGFSNQDKDVLFKVLNLRK